MPHRKRGNHSPALPHLPRLPKLKHVVTTMAALDTGLQGTLHESRFIGESEM
jgi:hypothetical protein